MSDPSEYGPVILLVAADGSTTPFADALPDRRCKQVSSPAEARAALEAERPSLLVVDRSSIGPDGDDLVAYVRSSSVEATVPIVVVADEYVPDLPLLRFDTQVTRPYESETLRAAIDRALLASEYRDAVTELYDQCRQRAESGGGPLDEASGLRQSRERADDLLAELVSDDPHILSSLLWTPENHVGETGKF